MTIFLAEKFEQFLKKFNAKVKFSILKVCSGNRILKIRKMIITFVSKLSQIYSKENSNDTILMNVKKFQEKNSFLSEISPPPPKYA